MPTLADGIAIKVPGAVTRPLVEQWVDEIVAVTPSLDRARRTGSLVALADAWREAA